MDKTLTPEIRERLLSKLPFTQSATVEYTPECFLSKENDEYLIPEDFRPVFTLRAFTRFEMDAVKKTCTPDKFDEMGVRNVVRKCVMGWKNLYDAATSKEIDYTADANGGASKDIFDIMPIIVVTQLLQYLSQISGIIDIDKTGLKS